MTITTTILGRTIAGNYNRIYGKSVLSAGSSSGDVATGLSQVVDFQMVIKGDTQMGCSVNEAFPLASGAVTAVVETANATFYWAATGV